MGNEYPQYRFYVGKEVGNVSLWRRDSEESERPIVANTRGLTSWFTEDPGEYENVDPLEPSDAFWVALHGINRFGYRDPEAIVECEMYERVVVNAIGRPDHTQEQRELLERAKGEVGNDDA